jgi:hypothetical protein
VDFEALGRWQREGSLVHKEDVAYGLENAPKALLRLFSGENFGKQLIKVADAAAWAGVDRVTTAEARSRVVRRGRDAVFGCRGSVPIQKETDHV